MCYKSSLDLKVVHLDLKAQWAVTWLPSRKWEQTYFGAVLLLVTSVCKQFASKVSIYYHELGKCVSYMNFSSKLEWQWVTVKLQQLLICLSCLKTSQTLAHCFNTQILLFINFKSVAWLILSWNHILNLCMYYYTCSKRSSFIPRLPTDKRKAIQQRLQCLGEVSSNLEKHSATVFFCTS